ncbi:MAG TPA: EAL domain-containing protein [Rhodanobacteraceae bacterium]|jgi:PleD family two-component response regulator/EAL domain-containing protein (putative c-di-GMP-specific phosphodiesterase class I)|nr:EAL domain-containing protein [Rhodanobacteraceae bacterium]
MLMRDFHVHGVELTGLFLAQLPQRLARLHSRGDRLHREGWDINTLYLLADDAATLASACRGLDAGELADCLEALSATVEPLFDPPRVPDSAVGARIASLLRELKEKPLPVAVQATAAQAGVVVPGPIQDQGFPLLVTPPAEYWLRFAGTTARVPIPEDDLGPSVGDNAKASADTSTAQSAPAAAETAAIAEAEVALPLAAPVRHTVPTHKTAFHLGRAEPPSTEIDRYLSAQGYQLTAFDSVDELKELLVALPPHLVIVDAAFENALDEIGALVKRARAEVSERIWLIALSEDSELPRRLRAVRAGCDAFIALPAKPADVIARIGELIETERTNPYRIMIVEDDRSQTLFAESILRKAGMETLAINEGLSALDELDRFRPELILMDLYMPDVDGMELTALIREREAFISTPIVFLSGESDADKHFEALNAGGDDFLSKPIRPKHLISAVTNRVRRARQMSSRQLATAASTSAASIDGTVSREALLQRLAEWLAMEDAPTRAGGLLVFELEDATALRARLGETRGDRLLGEIGQFLASHAGPKDLVAREGDSGFLLLNSDREVAALEGYAANIRDRLARETFASAEAAARFMLDAGVCAFRDSGGDALAMLNTAKATVAKARKEGRHGVFLVHDANTTNDAEIARQIRFALDGAGLQILFQPIVSLHGEEREQFQALLRLQGDDGRQYVAAELVPVAERAGLIAEIDRWVFAQCVAMIVERTASGRAPRLFLSQSVASVRDEGRIDWMRELLEREDVRGENVSLELTATNAAAALDDVAGYGARIKPLGLTLTLSGFEAGAAGERLLNALPVDYIKLSPRYVRIDDDAMRKELREFVALAHERSIQVIAPRVEDARGAAALWSAGVDFIQGNFVQRAGHDLAFDFHASVM